jgi:hypothetical protein
MYLQILEDQKEGHSKDEKCCPASVFVNHLSVHCISVKIKLSNR